jgi:xanthine dehydrogenase accessory factor
MRDRLQIVQAFESLRAVGQSAALVTVVFVEGSSYRRPGARMLVASDGQSWGTISGGCLERDVVRRARFLIPEPHAPQIVAYETDTDDAGEENARPVTDPGPSLGCGGRIEILLQRITAENPGPLAALCAVVRQRRRAAIATVIRVGSAIDNSVSPGQQVIRIVDDSPESAIKDPALNDAIRQNFLQPTGSFQIHRHSLSRAGWAEVCTEWLTPAQSLAIFGDGHDVAPLVHLGHFLGWHVTVIGSRSLAVLQRNFPKADHLISATDDAANAAADLPHDSAAIVMGHNFRRDAAILAELLRHPREYIGVLGPRRRTSRLLASIGRPGQDENLFSPIGLDIGAENPEQIALSIVAEIQAVAAARPGQSLRNRPGPIHIISTAPEISLPQ